MMGSVRTFATVLYLSSARSLPLLMLVFLFTGSAIAQDTPFHLSGPFSARNLTLFLVHSHSGVPHTYLTLDEAIKQGKASLRETNSTNLLVDNKSNEDIFIQAGEIVKGGQQDRMIATDMLVAPGMKSIPLAAYCVEHDRSTQRGSEPLAEFSSAAEYAPLPEMRLAGGRHLLTHANSVSASDPSGYTAPALQSHSSEPSSTNPALQQELSAYLASIPLQETATEKAWQQQVWDGVATIQDRLTRRVGTSVRSSVSPSSLELTLEESASRSASDSLVDMLKPWLHIDSTTTGIVFAVNGKFKSADIYSSSSLFRKCFPKLLRAAAIEALVDSAGTGADQITLANAELLLAQGKFGTLVECDASNRLHLKSWDSASSVLFESRDIATSDPYLHRGYIFQ
jgi:hypothetical protein